MGNTNMKYHLVYGREYLDSSEKYDPYFYSYSTIFRNVPADLVPTLMSFKDKIKNYCDKNYKEEATNFQNRTVVKILSDKDYYETYKDVYGEETLFNDTDNLFNDYGQRYNTRQFFKYDFDSEFTEKYSFENLNKEKHYVS
jgi:hypothetical protein